MGSRLQHWVLVRHRWKHGSNRTFTLSFHSANLARWNSLFIIICYYFSFNLHFRERERALVLGSPLSWHYCMCSCWKILVDVYRLQASPVQNYICNLFLWKQKQTIKARSSLTFILFANQAEAPACYLNPSSWSAHVGELARPQEKEMVGLGWEREKKVLLKQFSKALRPTGVECADNSWPFWSVTSLGSCTSRKREGEGGGGV